MRVLLLIVQYPPDVNSTGLLMEQVARGLLSRGHKISVITTFPHYENFSVRPADRGKWKETTTDDGITVTRLFTWIPGRKTEMLNRLASYLSFNLLALFAIALSKDEHDVILCTNGSFFTGITAFIGGDKPFIYNIQDLYPDTFVEQKLLTHKWPIKVLGWIEKLMYSRAAGLAVITPAFRANLLQKNVPDEKISVIPNFVNVDSIRPLPKDNEFSREHDLVDKFVIMHAGNVGYAYDLESLIHIAPQLRSHDDIVILIIGNGAARPELERLAKSNRSNNVIFLPFQPASRLPILRASSDVQVSLYKHGSAKHSMPSKVYEIMASGRPLLASADPGSDIWNLVNDTGCGICIEPEDPQSLKSALLKLYDDPQLRKDLGERGRAAAIGEYATDIVVARYEELLTRVSRTRTI